MHWIKLVSSGVKRFTIDTDSMADFGFMLDTLKELNRQTTGDLILKMKKTAVTSQEVETAIGNRPVYDITLWEVKNGKETAVNLSGKTVSIAIPYTPAKNEQPGNLYAVYVDENGNVQWISKSSYNMDQKAVIFVAEHFSIYGIGYKNQIQHNTIQVHSTQTKNTHQHISRHTDYQHNTEIDHQVDDDMQEEHFHSHPHNTQAEKPRAAPMQIIRNSATMIWHQ